MPLLLDRCSFLAWLAPLVLLAVFTLPANAQTSHFEAAKALYRSQDFSGALKELQASREANERVPSTDLYIGMCEAQLEHWQESSSELSRYVKSYPSDAHGWYWLGNAQFFQRQFVEAEASFQRAVGLDGSYDDAYRGLGLAKLERKDYQGAYRSWLKAVDLNQNDEKTFYYLGRLFYQANLPNQAAYWLRRAITLDSGDYQAATYLGLCAEALGFDDVALRLYRNAVSQSDADGKPYAWAFLSLGKALVKHGNESEALAVLEEGASKCPEAHELAYLGELFAADGRAKQAEDVLRQAIAMDPSVAQAHYRLGLLLQASGKKQEALQQMEEFQRAKDKENQKAVKITVIRK